MRWWIPLARICKSLGRYRLIRDREENDAYLHRYYLVNTRWVEEVSWLKKRFPKLSFNLVLHHCVRSDVDGLHDHPWPWKSKILEGGYWESAPGPDGNVERTWRGPEDGWRSRLSTDYHRLELPHEGASCWSLFFMGPREKDWGFQDRDGNWVQWQEYIENRDLYV